MLSWVTWAMTSRAMGPRSRAAPKTEAAAASATFREGATMWYRASSARLAWSALRTPLVAFAGCGRVVVEVRTGVSFVRSGWWVGPHLATQRDSQIVRISQARRNAQQQQCRVATAPSLIGNTR